jgi:uncharacterized DUF497 family protein
MALRFSWDPRKAAANWRKHRIGFEEAATAFADKLSLTIPDPDHLVGLSVRNRLLVVSHVERGDEIRLISARLASRRERRNYEEDI